MRKFLFYFFAIVAIALGLSGLHLFMSGWTHWAALDRVWEDEPLRLAVDLSKASSFQGTHNQTFRNVPSAGLMLHVQPEFSSDDELTQAFEDLAATATLTDPSGKVAWRSEWSRDSVRIRSGPEGNHIAEMSTDAVPLGQYQFSLEVTKGAAGLAGRKQTLTVTANYPLCGIEYLGPLYLMCAAVGCWFVAAWTSVELLLRLRRARRARKRNGEH